MSSLGRRGFKIDDRVLLAGVLLVLGISLVVFAGLIVSGAGKFGGGDDPDSEVAAQGAPTSAVAGTPPVSTSTPVAQTPVATATQPATTGQSGSDDRPVVCIDVGHGGVDLGNVRTNDDDSEILTMEKDLTLAQALDLRDRLEAAGIDVVLTRDTDTEVNSTHADVNGDGEGPKDDNEDGEIDTALGEGPNNLDELQARVNVCNDAGADLLISIHVNSAKNVHLQGYEAWWAEDDTLPDVDGSAQFAQLAVAALGEQFANAGYETVSRGASPDTADDPPDDDPTTFDHYLMISPDVPARNFVGPKMPAIIVECLFLSNDDDYAFLTDDPDAAQNAIVSAYEEAILEYFEIEPGQNAAVADAQPTPTPEASEDVQPTPDATSSAWVAGDGSPRPQPLADSQTGRSQVHYWGDDPKQVALTFDLGSDRGYTEQILDFLEENNIRATFGLTGAWAEENPDLVQRIVADGHQLINHTYDHQSFTGFSTGADPLTEDERVEEIQRTDQIVRDLTGYEMAPYFRLPYGDGSDDEGVLTDIYSAGYYLTIMWTCDSYGWKQATPAEIIQNCGPSSQTGPIILMHVGSDGTDQDALPGLVEAYRDEGYSFVTVEELLQP